MKDILGSIVSAFSSLFGVFLVQRWRGEFSGSYFDFLSSVADGLAKLIQ